LVEEFPGLRVAAEYVYAAACGFEDPDTRSDTLLIADLDEKLLILHYDRVEDAAESLLAHDQQDLGPATPIVS
jgi:hypothetical protein